MVIYDGGGTKKRGGVERGYGDYKLKERGKTLEMKGKLKSKLTFLRDVQQPEMDFLEHSVVVSPTFLGK